MNELARAIERIRTYRDQHPELRRAHHFLFDLHMIPGSLTADYVIMGLNPGEDPEVWKHRLGPTEETSAHDFFSQIGLIRSQNHWYKRCEEMCSTQSSVMTEFFFWSSRNMKEFVARFGPLKRSKHVEFCVELNKQLIDFYQPKAVVFTGLTYDAYVAAKFGLRDPRTENATLPSKGRLLVRYTDGVRPWIFTKHWTGSFGFSNDQKRAIQNHLARYRSAED